MFKKKKVLCVIPARSGSKGLKNKNTANLGNQPLIAWPINSALKSKYVDKVVVSQIGLERFFVKKVIDSYGRQAISFSFDYQENDKAKLDELKQKISNFLEEGFGELILNNTSRDGAAIGIDHLLLKEISRTVDVPVVIGCGAKGVADIAAAFKIGADGVSTSTFLSATDQSPKQIRAHLHSMGINIRVSN